MESNAMKAITIGVGVLIAIATISLVMMYYNTAKAGMSAVGRGNDLNANYYSYIVDVLTESQVYGTDVINLLNYFEDDMSVTLNLFDKNGNKIDRHVYRNKIKPNEKFLITVNNDSVTDITVEAID